MLVLKQLTILHLHVAIDCYGMAWLCHSRCLRALKCHCNFEINSFVDLVSLPSFSFKVVNLLTLFHYIKVVSPFRSHFCFFDQTISQFCHLWLSFPELQRYLVLYICLSFPISQLTLVSHVYGWILHCFINFFSPIFKVPLISLLFIIDAFDIFT